MECGGIQKGNAGLIQAALDRPGVGADTHAERFEKIGASALARDRPVAMFRDAHATGGEHEGRHG
jgi:hypothetical protein